MKKIVVCVVALIALVAVIAAVPAGKSNTEFLRIHIRADSNDTADQNVKYAVKSAVVEYLTPYIANARSKNDAMNAVKKLSTASKACATACLRKTASVTSPPPGCAASAFPTEHTAS